MTAPLPGNLASDVQRPLGRTLLALAFAAFLPLSAGALWSDFTTVMFQTEPLATAGPLVLLDVLLTITAMAAMVGVWRGRAWAPMAVLGWAGAFALYAVWVLRS